MHGFILTPTYRVVRGVPEVHLYGVLESGEPCLIIDDRTRPHFFIRQRDWAQTSRLAPTVAMQDCPLHSLDGEAVALVRMALPADVPPLRRTLEAHGITCLEADVRFAYRYLIDRGIRGAFHVEGPSSLRPRLGRVYRNPEISSAQWMPQLKLLSIDIETNREGTRLYSIALHGAAADEVIIVHPGTWTHATSAASEKAAILLFLDRLQAIDPDIITGWNVVDFDLAVLARIAQRHGLRLTVGRTLDDFERRQDAAFTRESRAVVFGRQVLDGLALMRGAFIRLEDYRLETAAQAFLGKGKLLGGNDRAAEIEDLYRNDPQRLIDYNLHDARLVRELLDETGLVALAIERSLLTGMQLDRVSAAIASVDSLYLGALRRRGVVAPSVGVDVPSAEITGGYVMESTPGLYDNVLVFDFKSLYPSIIRTFNLDPLTYVPPSDQVPPGTPLVRAPNGARFRQDRPGILPELLTQLAAEREQAKRTGQLIKANAVKILMNSFYGVLGAGASRLFSPEIANAVTHFGQALIRRAAAFAEARGYDVLYGDTDSLFVHPRQADPDRAGELGVTLRAEIGAAVARAIEVDFGCRSLLELEFEKVYRRFFLPEVRGGRVGSKKRYAGLVVRAGAEEIECVGLESVRRDWSAVSKRFQQELLRRVFHDEPVEAFIRNFVADLRAGRFDDLLVYKKAIRKDLSAYTATTPPHVKAARKQAGNSGRIVAYVVTVNGPEPVGQLTAPPDYTHYIERQLAPIADAILRFLHTDFAAIVHPTRQLALF